MPRYARYRAPAESGQKLVAPPWRDLGVLLRENAASRAQADGAVLGQSIASFAAAARKEIIAAAATYVQRYAASGGFAADGPRAAEHAPIIVTGHQPDLFHPGVWLKNFAAANLARRYGGLALNLIIDGDACHSTAIRVPAGSPEHPQFGVVHFDRLAANVPWEERGVADQGAWESFADRVRATTKSLLPARMLDSWWPRVVERSHAAGRAGLAIAQARHQLELSWGQQSLELPQSLVCATESFRRFACHVLLDLRRFITSYNDSLAAYRKAHRIRNHAQPVPNLAVAGEWLEAPFWLWSADSPQRRPAFVRFDPAGLIVSDRAALERRLPLASSSDAESAVQELERWEREGCKLRSRALMTTMFSRLALADLFIHGIGGAKYDEATDGICERFFGAAPPAFATISGTLHLPIARPGDRVSAARRLRERLRELKFHPEKFLAVASGAPGSASVRTSRVEDLVAEKWRWVRAETGGARGAQRHRGIARANAALRGYVQSEFDQTLAELDRAGEQLRAAHVLNSREYAFCLFPLDILEHFLLDFSSLTL
ncbi:MAG: hypothetical protein IT424_04410 [Pirellulales bacterium]|nr:hypothetical protein [Pirellulales bacterium]